MKDGHCKDGFVGISSEITRSRRCEVAARLATHASSFSGSLDFGGLGGVHGKGCGAREFAARTGRHGTEALERSWVSHGQHSGGQASDACGHGRAVLTQLGKKRRLEK